MPLLPAERAGAVRSGLTGVAALGLALALTSCAAQVIASKEEMLSAAGFGSEPINTPERAALANSLPPTELIRRASNGQFEWVYSDPNHCGCIYVGDQTAYQRYALLRVQRQTAELNVQAAQLNYWGWGPWGPWCGWGPPCGPWW
jgi:hypothetical protein